MIPRLKEIAVAFAAQAARPDGGSLCDACVSALDVSAAGITLMVGAHSGPICSSDRPSAVLEDLQFTLGEGPCRDAFDSGAPVASPALGAADATRWPGFVEYAVRSGFGACFAYPLLTAASRIGVMTLYQDVTGPLTPTQHTDALAISGILAETVLAVQAATDHLAPELDDVFAHRAEVHQATGMVSAQLDVSPVDALAAIRAHAFSHDRPIGEVAADIVARRLRLDDTRNDGGSDG